MPSQNTGGFGLDTGFAALAGAIIESRPAREPHLVLIAG